MSRHTALPASPVAARPSARGGIRSVLKAVVATLRVWAMRHRGRRDLLELSPEMVKDIGLDREAIYGEAAKPFWKR